MLKNRAALPNFASPFGQCSRHSPCAVGRERHTECAYYFVADEEFVNGSVAELVLQHAGQDHAVGSLVGAVAVMRVEIDVFVATAGVCLAEIEERRAAEAGF